MVRDTGSYALEVLDRLVKPADSHSGGLRNSDLVSDTRPRVTIAGRVSVRAAP